MSSFIVNDVHIEQIVLYGEKVKGVDIFRIYHDNEKHEFSDLRQICFILADANCDSVNYNYAHLGENNKPSSFDNIGELKVFNPLQIIQFIRCLDYQSCDHPYWKSSLAYTILKDIEYYVISYMMKTEFAKQDVGHVWEFKEDVILNADYWGEVSYAYD